MTRPQGQFLISQQAQSEAGFGMPREIEKAAVTVLTNIFGPPLPTPDWLVRPGKQESGDHWPLVQEIYHRLTGLELPDVMRPVERRMVDGVFESAGGTFIFELDETQHFNTYRASTLRCYTDDVPLAFDKDDWIRRCERKARLEGGGFAKPKPPLFSGENGRHKQRAFRDALSDLIPSVHGFLPTLRLGDFEVGAWVERGGAVEKMAQLVHSRYGQAIP